jgi:hypothetical protein
MKNWISPDITSDTNGEEVGGGGRGQANEVAVVEKDQRDRQDGDDRVDEAAAEERCRSGRRDS